MPLRRSTCLLVLLSTLLVTGVAACGDDAASPATSSSTTKVITTTTLSTSPTTTTGGDTSPAPTTAPGGVTTPTTGSTTQPGEEKVSDVVFNERVKTASANLDAAGSDLCKIWAAGWMPRPSTSNQVRTEVDYLDREFTAIANALPATDKAVGDQLRSAVNDLRKEAAAANYDPSLFGDGPEAFSSKEFTTAMNTVMARTQNCPAN